MDLPLRLLCLQQLRRAREDQERPMEVIDGYGVFTFGKEHAHSWYAIWGEALMKGEAPLEREEPPLPEPDRPSDEYGEPCYYDGNTWHHNPFLHRGCMLR